VPWATGGCLIQPGGNGFRHANWAAAAQANDRVYLPLGSDGDSFVDLIDLYVRVDLVEDRHETIS
jgi:hypothetical protein